MINATEALPLNNVKTVVIYKVLSSSVKPVIQDGAACFFVIPVSLSSNLFGFKDVFYTWNAVLFSAFSKATDICLISGHLKEQ